MKKQLFIGSALLAAIGAFAQAPEGKTYGGIKEVLKHKYVLNETPSQATGVTSPAPASSSAKRSSAAAVNEWSHISQSMNFFGVLVPDSKPLYYNHELDAVSFIQRVSPHYTPNPVPSSDAKSGVMVAMVSPNWGETWDSTCIFNNDLYLSRYPQGGIYNPPGNTKLSEAYVVAMGPATTPLPQLWIGNWFASKKLDVYTNMADTTDPLSQQFIYSNPVDPVVGKVDFARQDFSITDDGLVRTAGGIYNSVNPSFSGFRGVRIVKGQFTSGHFTWASDSIPLSKTPVFQNTVTGEYTGQIGLFNMAWGESGQYGYVWFYGIATNGTGSNLSVQPIVWKTSNYGNSWGLVAPIDFEANENGKFDIVLNRLDPATDWPGKRLPFFNYLEEFGGIVDGNNELHIVSTIVAMKDTTNGDMVTYTNTIGDGEVYHYKHTEGNDPLIYDFSTKTDANGDIDWEVVVVDSMRTEAPSAQDGFPGYEANPWTPYEGSKQAANARIQLSRSPDGKFIIYTWAESSTDITTGGKRWNNKPDIHVRLRVTGQNTVNAVKHDVSGGASEVRVQAQAFLHNTSPICKVTEEGVFYVVKLPLKISNSGSLQQDQPADHFYSTAELQFPNTTVGIWENTLLTENSSLYPNPAQNSTMLKVELSKSTDVSVTVMNTVGQVISTSTTKGVAGKNEINVDVQGLSTGIYMVNVKTDGANITKKLIVK